MTVLCVQRVEELTDPQPELRFASTEPRQLRIHALGHAELIAHTELAFK
jgi:hypothetical protein